MQGSYNTGLSTQACDNRAGMEQRPFFYVPPKEEVENPFNEIKRKSNEVSVRSDARNYMTDLCAKLCAAAPDLSNHLTKQDKAEFKQFINEILETI